MLDKDKIAEEADQNNLDTFGVATGPDDEQSSSLSKDFSSFSVS